MKARASIAVLGVAILTACADSGAQKIGLDTYLISVRVPFTGQTGAKHQALSEAANYCATQEKEVQLQTVNAEECALHGGCGEAQITFLCLLKTDPRYTAPTPPPATASK